MCSSVPCATILDCLPRGLALSTEDASASVPVSGTPEYVIAIR